MAGTTSNRRHRPGGIPGGFIRAACSAVMVTTLVMVGVAGAVEVGAQGTVSDAEAICAVAPRSAQELVDRWFDDEGTPRPLEGSTLVRERALDGALGEPADVAVAEAVATVAHEWVACTNTGDQLRAYALLSDAYLGQMIAPGGSPGETRALLGATPAPRPADLALSIGPALQTRVFPDGQVGAMFAMTGTSAPGESLTVFMLFEEVEGAWRIAGMHQLAAPPPTAPVLEHEVVAEYPHDTGAFTQGLMLIDSTLYEGTGQEGESELRRVDLETGEVLQSVALEDDLFGEGVVVLGDRIYQLTWQAGICFVYDRGTFELQQTFSYEGEGWGLATDGERLIMSDGSNQLEFRDPETFAVLGTVDVQDAGLPVSSLNELEYIDGEVWANVWLTDWIVRIDAATGEVTGWLDLTGLQPLDHPGAEGASVLNGIAWDAETGRLLVTGKYWPLLFELELEPAG